MKKKLFVITVVVYLLTTLADLGLTYLNTPDLSRESNPLVTVFGLGWGALITVAALSVIMFVSLTYYSCFKYKTIHTNDRRLTEYVSSITYGRPDKFWTGGIPKHVSSDIAALGFALPWGMSIYRFICICEWLTVTFKVETVMPFSILRMDSVAIIPSVTITLILFFCWFYSEFKEQRNVQNVEKSPV